MNPEPIQTVTNYKHKDIIDPLRIYMYVHTLFNPALSSKTIRYTHPILQNAIDYMQKIEREFLFVKEYQQTESDMVMPIDITARSDPMRQ